MSAGWRQVKIMGLEIRHVVVGDERVVRDLRVEAMTHAPGAFGATVERVQERTVLILGYPSRIGASS